jgi:hypothetical protein
MGSSPVRATDFCRSLPLTALSHENVTHLRGDSCGRVPNQGMSEKQITARVRDIKQEDIGIFSGGARGRGSSGPTRFRSSSPPDRVQVGNQRLGYEQLPQSLGYRRTKRMS